MRSVLITGANRGIGLEHARRYAERGARVWATARAPEDAADLQALAKAHSGRVEVVRYDAARLGAAGSLKSRLGDEPLDLMLANAGATGGRAQLRRRSAFNPWNRPQSTRIRVLVPRSRYLEPVTVPAPPRKDSSSGFRVRATRLTPPTSAHACPG